jgi:hypothetical protein
LALGSVVHAEQGGTGHYVAGATALFIDALPGKPGWAFENVCMNYNDGTASASKGLPFLVESAEQ